MSGLLRTWDEVRGAVRPIPGALPNGVYREELSGADVARVTGEPADFTQLVLGAYPVGVTRRPSAHVQRGRSLRDPRPLDVEL